MRSIVIVDDEFLVRLGLKTTMNWEEHGFRIVGEASNGAEALDVIKECQPDIVLTDIQMPIMDGIELIENIRKKDTKTKVIILSNHENFYYAKQAMKLGVEQYILKSEISEDNLLAILEDVRIELIDQVGEVKREKNEKEEYLKYYLRKCEVNKIPQLDVIGNPEKEVFEESSYLIFKGYCTVNLINESAEDMFLKTVRTLISELFSEATSKTMIYRGQCYSMVIVPVEAYGEEWKAVIREKIGIIRKKIKYYFSLSYKGATSSLGDSTDFVRILKEAEQARGFSFFLDTPVIFFDEIEESAFQQQKRPHVSGSLLNRSLDRKSEVDVKQHIKEVFLELNRIKSFEYVEYSVIKFLTIAREYVEERSIEKVEILKGIKYDNLYTLSNIDDVEFYVTGIYERIVSESGSGGMYSASIQKCIHYIEEFYAHELTLDEIACHVDISKNYLSMLFKQEMGINFVTYLNRYRIDRAKEILKESNQKIYEVAEKVGFYSPYYFSKVFKEITGLTCKEYRDNNFDLVQRGEK